MTGFILWGIILVYAGIVISRKVKQIKSGKYCSCNCSSCPGCAKRDRDIDAPLKRKKQKLF